MKNRKIEFAIDRAPAGQSGYLVAYFPINDPLVPESNLTAYKTANVDVIELGIKTDNPYADGDIIANSMRRSQGIGTIAEAHSAIEKIRNFEYDTLGMIFAYAEEKLSPKPELWKDVDGLLCLGNADEQSSKMNTDAHEHGTRITRFVPYDLAEKAVAEAANASGFVMLQYTDGKTGIRDSFDPILPQRIARLKDAGVSRPILTGIGISSKDQIRHAMDNGADGVILGSMSVIKGEESVAALEDYLCGMREVLNGG